MPRSTYYKALVRVPSNRELEATKFQKEIKEIYLKSKKTYGKTRYSFYRS